MVSLAILTFHGESLKHNLLKENCFKFDKPNLGLCQSLRIDKFRGIVKQAFFEITLPRFALFTNVLPRQTWIASLKIHCLLCLNKGFLSTIMILFLEIHQLEHQKKISIKTTEGNYQLLTMNTIVKDKIVVPHIYILLKTSS